MHGSFILTEYLVVRFSGMVHIAMLHMVAFARVWLMRMRACVCVCVGVCGRVCLRACGFPRTGPSGFHHTVRSMLTGTEGSADGTEAAAAKDVVRP